MHQKYKKMTIKHKNTKKCKKCQMKIALLNSMYHESNFCRDKQHIKAKEKKMQMQQVPGLPKPVWL